MQPGQPSYTLWAIDSAHGSTEPEASGIAAVLVLLEQRCSDHDQKMIADQLVFGQQTLRDKGINLTILAFGQQTTRLLADPQVQAFHGPCAQLVALSVIVAERRHELGEL